MPHGNERLQGDIQRASYRFRRALLYGGTASSRTVLVATRSCTCTLYSQISLIWLYCNVKNCQISSYKDINNFLLVYRMNPISLRALLISKVFKNCQKAKSQIYFFVCHICSLNNSGSQLLLDAKCFMTEVCSTTKQRCKYAKCSEQIDSVRLLPAFCFLLVCGQSKRTPRRITGAWRKSRV